MKLLAKSKHKIRKEKSEVIGITRDGWVITLDGAFGDIHEDCEVELDMTEYLKEFRSAHELTQQEMSWMLGVSRTTYILYEQGKQEISLKEFFILASYLPDNKFKRLQEEFISKNK